MAAAKVTSWLFKMSHEKQDTLLKLTVLTMAAILCEIFSAIFRYHKMCVKNMVQSIGVCTQWWLAVNCSILRTSFRRLLLFIACL